MDKATIRHLYSFLSAVDDTSDLDDIFDMGQKESPVRAVVKKRTSTAAGTKTEAQPYDSFVAPLNDKGFLYELTTPLSQYILRRRPENLCDVLALVVDEFMKKGMRQENLVALLACAGEIILRQHHYDMAAEIYRITAQYCQKFRLSRDIFARYTLELSRIDYLRGSNPVATAELQSAALANISEPITADEALLLMYAGLVQHFMGNEQEGHNMRQQGYEQIRRMNDRDLENSAIQLIGWHIYLQGRFNESIEFYEEMVLGVENRKNVEIAALAYIPVIYSYMFRGEFYRGLILNEMICSFAIERNDHTTALLMRSIGERVRVSANDDEKYGETLYRILAEATQRNFVWGQYYTLFTLCLYHFHLGQIKSCREDILLLNDLKAKNHIGRFYSSPFMLDVLYAIEQQGLDSVPGMSYEGEVLYQSTSFCIHLRGAALRHLALLKKERNAPLSEVLDLMEESIRWLTEAGNPIELGNSYVQMARITCGVGRVQLTRHYATLGKKAYGSHEKMYFPNELLNYVESDALDPGLDVQLRALNLELTHMVDAKALALRLLTQLGRILKVESGGFVVYYHDSPTVVATQNIDRRQDDSAQLQRMMGWISYAKLHGEIFSRYQDDGGRGYFHPDFSDIPSFLIALPFYQNNEVRAIIYFESYYRNSSLSGEEKQCLDSFAQSVSLHMMAALFYKDEALPESEKTGMKATRQTRMESCEDICLGVSKEMYAVYNQISLIAPTQLPVLLMGETGVGKEVFAKEVYRLWGHSGPFVKVNCSAIPETLFEGEMFGYERGSFTGAIKTHRGYFEQADDGTLFLDEIGELSLVSQVKLLRVLQEKEIRRIGGNQAIKVNFRLIAATNRDLRTEVELGTFRSDLYFRLGVLPVEIPPLRGRKADIAPLADFFLRKHEADMHLPICNLTADDMSRLMEYPWPGNVRELENAIQRGMLLAKNGYLELSSLTGLHRNFPELKVKTLEEIEREHICKVLNHCGGKISGSNGAATLLGLKRTTLLSRMNKLGIQREA